MQYDYTRVYQKKIQDAQIDVQICKFNNINSSNNLKRAALLGVSFWGWSLADRLLGRTGLSVEYVPNLVISILICFLLSHQKELGGYL
jgi:hypothetical protein